MSEKLLMEIRDLLAQVLAEMKSEAAPAVSATKAPAIEEWLAAKNAEIEAVEAEEPVKEDATEETAEIEAEPEVLFELLPGVDPAGLENYIGKPISEVDRSIVKMIADPVYSVKFAPKKFPENVIEAIIKAAEEED